MASFAKSNACWAPNPCPERGVKFVMDTNGKQIVYGSGKTLVVRDVANPLDAQVYIGHKKPVTCVRFTRDGKLVASGDEAGVVNVIDSSSMELKKESAIFNSSLFDIAFDHTGKRMAVCADVSKGVANKAFLWESGTPQGDLVGNSKRVISIDIRPDSSSKLAVGGEDFQVKLHNGPPYKFTHSFDQHKNYVQTVRYSPDGALLATAGSDKMIYLLDAETGELKTALPETHKGSIYALSWSQDGKQLMSCSGDKSVALWDIASSKLVKKIDVGRNVLDMQMGCAFADQPISVSLSGDLNYLDFGSGKISNVINAHNSTPLHVTRDWAGDKDQVYVGTFGGDIFGYMKTGEATRFDGASPGASDGVVVNKGQLWSCGHDDILRGACVGDGSFSFKSSAGIGSMPIDIDSPSADPGLSVVVTASNVKLFRDGKECDSKPLKGFKATAVGIAMDGSECTVGGNDKAGHVFSICDDKLTDIALKFGAHQGSITKVAYSPNGPIAMADNVKEITLWNGSTHENIHKARWVYHGGKVCDLAWSPSGSHLASAGLDGQIIIWLATSTMKKTKLEKCHAYGVNSVAWLSDTSIVSAGNDDCVRTWTPKLP